MKFGNRFGGEILTEIEEKAELNVAIIKELLNDTELQLKADLEWKELVKLIEKTIAFQDAGELRSRRNLDPITCFVVLSHQHSAQRERQAFWDRALEMDALQAHCVNYFLYQAVNGEALELFKKEVEEIALNIGVQDFVLALEEWGDSFWTQRNLRFLLEELLGILGLRNKDGNGIRWSKSILWRERWLVGWLFRRLLEEDKELEENDRFLVLQEYNSVYALVFKSIVYGDRRAFRMARADKDDELQACLLNYRFGKDIKREGDLCSQVLNRFLQEGRYTSMDERTRAYILEQKLCGNEFNLLAPVERELSIAYIRAAINNEMRDWYKKKDKLVLSEDPDRPIADSGLSPEEKMVQEESNIDTRRQIGQINSIRRKIALSLEFNIQPEEAWCEEFAQDLSNAQGRPVTTEWVQEQCEHVIDCPSVATKNEALAQLFGVDAGTVRRTARRGRDDFRKIVEEEKSRGEE